MKCGVMRLVRWLWCVLLLCVLCSVNGYLGSIVLGVGLVVKVLCLVVLSGDLVYVMVDVWCGLISECSVGCWIVSVSMVLCISVNVNDGGVMNLVFFVL